MPVNKHITCGSKNKLRDLQQTTEKQTYRYQYDIQNKNVCANRKIKKRETRKNAAITMGTMTDRTFF